MKMINRWPVLKVLGENFPSRPLLGAVLLSLITFAHQTPAALVEAEIPPPPLVTVEALDAEAAEVSEDGEPDVAVFRFRRTGATDFDQVVNFGFYCPVCRFDKAPAENGVDFERVPTTITIPKGSDFADLVIRPVPDKALEGDEVIPVWIEDRPCILIYPPPPDCYLPGEPRLAIATLRDSAGSPPVDRPRITLKHPADGAEFVDAAEILFAVETFDPKGAITQVDWFVGDTRVGESVIHFIREPDPGTVIALEFVWKNPPGGDHLVLAVAHDASGRHVVGGPVRVKVRSKPVIDPSAATLEITEPKTGHTVPAGLPFRIAVTAVDPAADIRRVEFFANGNSIGISEHLTRDAVIPGRPRVHVLEWRDAREGDYELVARAVDAAGQTVQSKPVRIGVRAQLEALLTSNEGQSRRPDGQLRLVFRGDLTQVDYDVEVSQDLVHWEKYGRFTSTDASLSVLETDTTNAPARFYRAVRVVRELSPP